MYKNNQKIFNITITAVMAAIATIIYMIFPEINIVPGVSYMKIDFSDFPALLTGMVFGPIQGISVEVIKNLIHLTRTSTMGIGEIMNVLLGSGIILSMSFFSKIFAKIFKEEKMSVKVYVITAIISIIITIILGWFANIIFTPVFYALMGFPLSSVTYWAGVWGSTALNLVKAIFNIIPFYPVYLAVYKAFSNKNNNFQKKS